MSSPELGHGQAASQAVIGQELHRSRREAADSVDRHTWTGCDCQMIQLYAGLSCTGEGQQLGRGQGTGAPIRLTTWAWLETL